MRWMRILGVVLLIGLFVTNTCIRDPMLGAVLALMLPLTVLVATVLQPHDMPDGPVYDDSFERPARMPFDEPYDDSFESPVNDSVHAPVDDACHAPTPEARVYADEFEVLPRDDY